MPPRLWLIAVLVTLAVTLSACAFDSQSSSTSSDSPSAEANDRLHPDYDPSRDDRLSDFELAVTSGEPPKDLIFQASFPSNWTNMGEVNTGEYLYQVNDTSCTALFKQPYGYSDFPSVRESAIIERHVGDMAAAQSTGYSLGDAERTYLPAVPEDGTESVSVSVMKKPFTFDNQTEGDAYAYLLGDYALVLLTSCGPGEYAAVSASDFEPFVANSLGMKVTY